MLGFSACRLIRRPDNEVVLDRSQFWSQIFRVKQPGLQGFQVSGGPGTKRKASTFLKVTGMDGDHVVLIKGLVGAEIHAGTASGTKFCLPDTGSQRLLASVLIDRVHHNLPLIYSSAQRVWIHVFVHRKVLPFELQGFVENRAVSARSGINETISKL